MRLLSKHVDNIVSNDRVTNNVVIGFTETQISPTDFASKIMKTLNFFNTLFNNSERKRLQMKKVCCCFR